MDADWEPNGGRDQKVGLETGNDWLMNQGRRGTMQVRVFYPPTRSVFGATSLLDGRCKMCDLASFVRDIPDYPQPGILFRDITPLLANPDAIKLASERLAEPYLHDRVDIIAAAEARGFIFGASLAIQLGAGFVPIRRPGKLPFDLHSFAYELEYGTKELQVHIDGIQPGQRVLMVDDLLATGGTMEACCRLLEKTEAAIIGCTFLIHLVQLGGEERLSPYQVHSVLKYDQDDHEAELSL